MSQVAHICNLSSEEVKAELWIQDHCSYHREPLFKKEKKYKMQYKTKQPLHLHLKMGQKKNISSKSNKEKM